MSGSLSRSFTLLALCILFSLASLSNARAVSFVVTDGDFSGGVYEFRYLAGTEQTLVNGVQVAIGASPFLTNSGFSRGGDGNISWWEATGSFDALQLSGDATLGWDLSSVTGSIASIEVMSSAALFQFSPFADDAFEDQLFGQVSTPVGSFGIGC